MENKNTESYFVFDEKGQTYQVKGQLELFQRLKAKPEPTLRREVLQARIQTGYPDKQAGENAQMELDRRAFEATENLARRTTLYSGLIAIFASVLGVFVGFLLGSQ